MSIDFETDGKEAFVAQYDYIMIGAGRAGVPVAARLAENPETRVLLLQAGGKDTDCRFAKQL